MAILFPESQKEVISKNLLTGAFFSIQYHHFQLLKHDVAA